MIEEIQNLARRQEKIKRTNRRDDPDDCFLVWSWSKMKEEGWTWSDFEKKYSREIENMKKAKIKEKNKKSTGSELVFL
jgi:hypothetical protein